MKYVHTVTEEAHIHMHSVQPTFLFTEIAYEND